MTGQQPPHPNPIRVGIVGAGAIAQHQHIPGYLRRCAGVEIAALCDVDPARLQSVGQRYAIPRLTTDYTELVGMEEVDVVDICAWPNVHHPVALAAIAHGKPVFCEKPLALNYAQAREMFEAAAGAGLVTGVGFTHRLTPAARLAHRLISTHALGDIYHVLAVYALGGANFADQPMGWRRSKAIVGGGPLFELGSHMIDMVNWWLGQSITAVCAQQRTFVPQRRLPDSDERVDVDVEDAVTFLADLSGGGMALFVNSYVFTARNFEQRIEVYGRDGALIYDQARPYELQVCVGKEMVEMRSGYGLYDRDWGLYRQEEPLPTVPVPAALRGERAAAWERPPTQTLTPHFLAAVRGEAAPLLPTFYDGLRVQEVLEAVQISVEERRWVTLPLSD